MILNLIRFKGTDKPLAIRTKKAIVLESDDTDFTSIRDESSGEISQFRPIDVLSIGSVNESLIPKDYKKAQTKKGKPKGMTIE